MRLIELYLKRMRVLNELSIDFTEQAENHYTLDFLVGVNGTGKSTLLRTIAEIFLRLEDRLDFPFGFRITYELRKGLVISISNLAEGIGDQLPYLLLRENTQNTWQKRIIPLEYLPKLIIAFTTGSEREWALLEDVQEEIVNDTGNVVNSVTEKESNEIQTLGPEDLQQLTDLYLTELPGVPTFNEESREDNQIRANEEDQALTSKGFLFVKTLQLPLVILCGLLTDISDKNRLRANRGARLQQAMREASIEELRGFSLKFRMITGVISDDQRNFITQLAQGADQKLRFGTDYLLIYDLSEDPITSIAKIFAPVGTGLNLFRKLAALSESNDDEPILREVNLFLERTSSVTNDIVPPLHLLEWFSDGERSFLGRLCLFSLLGDQEALILLDEPEVHFNDFWKREIVHMLDDVLHGRPSHVLITSHSSITLTDVPRKNIHVLYRDADYTQEALFPQMETLAADPSDILINIFGAPQATGAQGILRVKKEISRALALRKLEDRVKALEVLLMDVAPGYWRFLVRRQLDEVRRLQQLERQQS
ncbi:hypothetical protein KDW_06990 [Dictyobacter vulcani]|uniref:ATPase AAA-type core domain-containing protein n=1 Tax=Dictyobacter vulcani TaxID=2607529 RepID=A0A5J4KJD1_9CHLR|nr:hypothetical protein KDW_06990 [Dictyobacter vulcani]